MYFMRFQKVDGTDILINMALVRAVVPDRDATNVCELRFVVRGDDVRVRVNYAALIQDPQLRGLV